MDRNSRLTSVSAVLSEMPFGQSFAIAYGGSIKSSPKTS